MKTLKVKLLTGRSGADGSHVPGDKIDLPAKEAISLILSNQAEPVNKKAYEAALADQQKVKFEDEEKQAEAKSILEKEKLETELNGLYNDVVLKEAELNGVVLNGEQILEMVEELKKRILPITNNIDPVSGDGE